MFIHENWSGGLIAGGWGFDWSSCKIDKRPKFCLITVRFQWKLKQELIARSVILKNPLNKFY